MRLHVVGLILTGIAAAQSMPSARVEGSVVSAAGGPVKGATVRIIGGALPTAQQLTAITTTADEVGKFFIDQIPPGAGYRLLVTNPGFVNGTVASFNLKEGEVKKDLTIVMTPQGIITGRVTDKDNDPVSKASITALQLGYQHGARALNTVGIATTDDKGEYRMANLAAGNYYLVARDNSANPDIESLIENGTIEKRGSQPVNLSTFYPNAPDYESASPLEVTSGGALRGVDIRMLSSRTLSIRGKAVNSTTGVPAGGVILRASAKSSNPRALSDPLSQLQRIVGRTESDGAFEVRLTPGEWLLTGIGGVTSGAPSILYSNTAVSVHERDLSGVILSLDGGITVSGSVRIEGGDIKKTIAAAAKSGLDAVQSALAAAGLNQVAGRPLVALYDTNETLQGSVQVNEDGTFKFALSVAPGKYRIHLTRVPADYYVKSIDFGGAHVTDDVLDFSSGGAASVDIALSDKPAELTGSLRDDKNQAKASAIVVLWKKEIEMVSSTNGVRTATTDKDGVFDFKGLPAGQYYVASWENAARYFALMQNRDLLAMFANDAAKVTVEEGAKQSVDPKYFSADRLSAAIAKLP